MKHLRLLIAAATLGALAAFTVAVRAQVKAPDKAEVALRAAMEKESVAGDLNAAIEQYKRIIANNGNNRAVAAKALLRMGQCYEKLGNVEARKAYERLVMEFADQAEPARAARERLAALAAVSAQAPEKPRFRKVGFPFKLSWAMPDGVFGAALSPDGKAFALSSEKAIWVVPVEGEVSKEITGEPRRVTPAMGVSDGLAWSADGNWIAFNLMKDKDGGQDICVVSSRGSEPKRVAHRPPAGGAAGPRYGTSRLSLSPEGKILAFTSVGEDGNLWDGFPGGRIIFVENVNGNADLGSQ